MLTHSLVLGLAAGLHAAAYGAYKDSPHESFLLRRFLRELFIATTAGAGLSLLGLAAGETAFVIYLSSFALSRIATEFWKLFVRVEPQEGYRIPTQMHWVSGIVHNPGLRLLLGLGFLASIYGIFALSTLIPRGTSAITRGVLIGLAIGTAEAIAGAYKDGSIEGFSWRKFFKSPAFGALGGLVAAGHTSNPVSLLLAAIGSMRMLLELVFKMVVPGYVPGKFRSMVGPYPIWNTRRRLFLGPYLATWGLYLVLATHSGGLAMPVQAAEPGRGSWQEPFTTGCDPATATIAQANYIVRGRMRPLLIWTGRHEVGRAHFRLLDQWSGNGRRFELLVGTDPDRAPMRLNRWTFVSETVCDGRATFVELTNEASEEPTRFEVIRASADGLSARSEHLTVVAGVRTTFRQHSELLEHIPPPSSPGTSMTLPPGTEPGFLIAMAGVVQDAAGGGTGTLSRSFVYNATLYELRARISRAETMSVNGQEFTDVRNGAFEIFNARTEKTTPFQVAFVNEADGRPQLLMATYRPRWWLEIELSLAPPAGN